MSDWIPGAFLPGLMGGGVVAFFGWLLKEAIKSELSRSLNDQAERIKFELQQEMLLAQLSTTEASRIYPDVLAKLLRSQGALEGDFQMEIEPYHDIYSAEDLLTMVSAMRLPEKESERLRALVASDRRASRFEILRAAKRRELGNARKLIVEARNLVQQNAVFLSPVVKEQALQACKAQLEASMWFTFGKVDPDGKPEPNEDVDMVEAGERTLAEARRRVSALEVTMRRELQPRGDPMLEM